MCSPALRPRRAPAVAIAIVVVVVGVVVVVAIVFDEAARGRVVGEAELRHEVGSGLRGPLVVEVGRLTLLQIVQLVVRSLPTVGGTRTRYGPSLPGFMNQGQKP